MEKKLIIGKPGIWFTFSFYLIIGCLISFPIIIGFDCSNLMCSNFNPHLKLLYITLIALILIILFYISYFRKPYSFIYIHEFLHKYKANKYNYDVKITVYESLKERRKLGRNGYCQFKDGGYSKHNIKWVYLAPFKFFMTLYVLFLIAALLCTIPVLNIFLYLMAYIIALQLPNCVADIKGFVDIQRSDDSIEIVYYSEQEFYFLK